MSNAETAAWNAAIEAVHRMVDEASSGHGSLWHPHDDGNLPNGGDVLDRLPDAILALRRKAETQ